MTGSPETLNLPRYAPGMRGGHYESFFVRANHPDRPLAFWIRYTVFSPRAAPEETIGELWAVWFDGERGQHSAAKAELPIDQCAFTRDRLDVRIGAASLTAEELHGSIVTTGRTVAWTLRMESSGAPLLLLPERLYRARLPRAKSIVGRPDVRFHGFFAVGSEEFEIDGWRGSQNHNWGSRHTDQYAWGQVVGFDTHSAGVLEVATARIRLGPVLLPSMTLLVLRLGDIEYRLNTIAHALRSHANVEGFHWSFSSETDEMQMAGTISAPRNAFVGLRYANPPGGVKHCLNTKIASCELRITDKSSNITEVLATSNRAAFEILTDRRDHGIEIRA